MCASNSGYCAPTVAGHSSIAASPTVASRSMAPSLSRPVIKGRPGRAGTARALGGRGATSGPSFNQARVRAPASPAQSCSGLGDRGRHGCAGTARALGGLGAISGPPASIGQADLAGAIADLTGVGDRREHDLAILADALLVGAPAPAD